MKISEAVIKAIRTYYDNADFSNYEKATGKPVKYKKDYFDKMEKELIPDIETPVDEVIEDEDPLEVEEEDDTDGAL